MLAMKSKNIIFPLSPDPTLRSEKNAIVTLGFLKGALKSKRIHNIAVTGGFGTGKSSLIRSYKKGDFLIGGKLLSFLSRVKRSLYKKCTHILRGNRVSQVDNEGIPFNRFLYVSVGEYASDSKMKRKHTGIQVSQEGEQEGEQQGKQQENQSHGDHQAERGEDSKSIRAIERRLLLQIFARFRRADLPQSSFRLIPESWKKSSWLIAILLGIFVFSVLLLIFHRQLGALLVAVNSMEGGPEWGAWIIAFLVEYKTLFRLFLSAYCIVFGGVASVLLCARILPRIRFHEFTVKGTYAELSLEQEAAESYLDHYSMELVYCLEKIAGKIDHVVVFEDLDRLDPDDCLYILTRLREINNLANLRLQKNGQHLCFIYVVNDNFLETVQHDKFFDYILPVIPEMNKRSASVLFAEKIKQIDSSYDVSRVFPRFETVASCLSDYRLQNTIMNEYQILLKLYTTTKQITEQKSNECSVFQKFRIFFTSNKQKTTNEQYVPADPQKNEILAFAIYKNCWPGDYHAISEDKSQVFTIEGVKTPNEFKGGKYEKLLEVLTDSNNQLLTLHSLHYANFSEKTLAEMYFNHWKSVLEDPTKHKEITGIIAELDAIQKDEVECIKKTKEFFNNLNHLIDNPEKEHQLRIELFRAVVSCMVRCEQEDNGWFFSDSKSNLRDRLSLLAGMNNDSDELNKKKFFILSAPKLNKHNFYSVNETDITSLKTISYGELKELCRGINCIPDSLDTKIAISDSKESLNELKNQIKAKFDEEDATPYFS